VDLWKWIALAFFILGFVVLPLFPYSVNWSIFPTAFCWFVAVLTFLVSIFSKRGSTVWKNRGQG
jgi:hypothetical protein